VRLNSPKIRIHTANLFIGSVLEATNWRLMSDGISYRVGFLTGRFHGYEHEEDLANLMRTKMKKIETSNLD
jgi:hypothetical protein